MICPNCKKKIRRTAKFCDQCGCEITSAPSFSGSHSAGNGSFLEEILSSISMNTVKVVALFTAVVLLFVILISSFFSGGSDNSFTYLKDRELYYSSVSGAKGKQASSQLLDGSNAVGDISSFVRIDTEGKKLFYIDHFDGSGYDLYYKRTARLGGKPKAIAEDINVYDINDKGNKVTYIKNGGDLYQHNLKKQSDKIDSNVMSFIVSDNGSKILYQKLTIDSDRYCVDLYYSKSGKEGTLVESAIDKICHISEDLTQIYYIKSGSLYKLNIGGKPKLISDKANNVIKIYDSGKIYFTASIDKGASLYYYNGKKDVKLVSNNFYSCEDVSSEKPVILYYTETVTDTETSYAYKIACDANTYTLEYDISSAHLSDDGEELYYITNPAKDSNGFGDLMKATVTKKKLKKPKLVDSNVYSGYYVSGKDFMYVKNYVPEKYMGEVYLNNKKVGEDIYWGFINYNEESKSLVYFTDVTAENRATINIYKGKRSKKIAENVLMYTFNFTSKGEFLFISDFESEGDILKICKNKSAKKVDTDVATVIPIQTNEEYDDFVRSKF